jgi:uncharacterized membrane protein YeiH
MTIMDWFQVVFIAVVTAVGLGGFVLAVLKKD